MSESTEVFLKRVAPYVAAEPKRVTPWEYVSFWMSSIGGSEKLTIFKDDRDPRNPDEQFNSIIEKLIAIRVDAAVKAALVGMVPAPVPPDLTSSTDQHGKFRCVMCGRPLDDHVEVDCPRGAAGRWAREQEVARSFHKKWSGDL